jgi:hypothetical protein
MCQESVSPFTTARGTAVHQRNHPPTRRAAARLVSSRRRGREAALDARRPVAINALEHCRVAVGYDTTRLLFADSWGATYCESNARGTDVCRAGYSLVDKWLVCVARE